MRSHVKLYVAFAQGFGLPDFPATLNSLQAFAEFLLQSVQAPKSVFNALASIKHAHKDLLLPVEVFDDWQLQKWRRAVGITCRHVPNPAPALPFELLEQLCELAGRLGEAGEVLAALLSFLFATMARLSSLLAEDDGVYDVTRLPTFEDLRFWEGIWQLKIKWAKAHQEAADGFWVPLLALGDSPACPVKRGARLRALAAGQGCRQPLFQCLGGGQGQDLSGKPLTKRVARAWLGVLLQRVGRDGEGFTYHSFRRGACSRAFEQGALEADIRQLGGWRSEAVRDYVPARLARRRAAASLTKLSFPSP